MKGKRSTRVAIGLGGAALCVALFFGGLFLGRERPRGDGQKEQVRAISGLGSLPSPELIAEADESRQADEDLEEGGEENLQEEPAGAESGTDSEEPAPTYGSTETPEPYEAPVDTGGSAEDSSTASPSPPEKPPIESTAGQ